MVFEMMLKMVDDWWLYEFLPDKLKAVNPVYLGRAFQGCELRHPSPPNVLLISVP